MAADTAGPNCCRPMDVSDSLALHIRIKFKQQFTFERQCLLPANGPARHQSDFSVLPICKCIYTAAVCLFYLFQPREPTTANTTAFQKPWSGKVMHESMLSAKIGAP